ncbi:hypothetical protein LTR27_013044 [Elasticomyces elasticus]|nr:hypothetical protein LTR27_013044 [Elasticomyces elasticus]
MYIWVMVMYLEVFPKTSARPNLAIAAFAAVARLGFAMNWDITISRCLGVVLQAALGCRAGDVARTVGYKGTEYMKFRDIDLTLDISKTGDPNVTLADVQATVTISHAKGFKNKLGESTVKYLKPLLDPEFYHVCPIALLLAHSLRNGLVAGGTTLQEVLNHAAHQIDHKIV